MVIELVIIIMIIRDQRVVRDRPVVMVRVPVMVLVMDKVLVREISILAKVLETDMDKVHQMIDMGTLEINMVKVRVPVEAMVEVL